MNLGALRAPKFIQLMSFSRSVRKSCACNNYLARFEAYLKAL